MMRFAADENFNNDVLRGLRRLHPEIDVIRIQDSEVYGADDPTVLEWAAREGRILLTYDRNTMTKYAYKRIAAGQETPGILVIAPLTPVGQVIDELAAIVGASDAGEWAGKVTYIPLR